MILPALTEAESPLWRPIKYIVEGETAKWRRRATQPPGVNQARTVNPELKCLK